MKIRISCKGDSTAFVRSHIRELFSLENQKETKDASPTRPAMEGAPTPMGPSKETLRVGMVLGVSWGPRPNRGVHE